jgi:hypothetical protein
MKNEENIKICFVKTGYSTCYTKKSIKYNIDEIIDEWLNRTQNLSFVTNFKSDIYVINTKPTKAGWFARHGRENEPLSKIHSNTYSPYDIDFCKYDIVITSDCIIPQDIINGNTKVLWCYYEDEHAFSSFKTSSKSPMGGYDVFLNHFMSSPISPKSLPTPLSFPYLENYDTFNNVLKLLNLDKTKKHDSIFIDTHIVRDAKFNSKKILLENKTNMNLNYTVWDFKNSMKELYSGKLPHIKSYLEKISKSKFFLYLRPSNQGIGQAMLPAAASDCIIVGMNKMKYASIVIHPDCIGNNVEDCCKIINTIKANSKKQEEIIEYQKNKLKEFFWDTPLNSLNYLLHVKQSQK